MTEFKETELDERAIKFSAPGNVADLYIAS